MRNFTVNIKIYKKPKCNINIYKKPKHLIFLGCKNYHNQLGFFQIRRFKKVITDVEADIRDTVFHVICKQSSDLMDSILRILNPILEKSDHLTLEPLFSEEGLMFLNSISYQRQRSSFVQSVELRKLMESAQMEIEDLRSRKV